MKNRNLDNHDNWKTPASLYNELDNEFNFDCDPCPLNHNTEEWDGLEIDWESRSFVNPPYSRKLKEDFIKKGIAESKKGKLSVFLLPASTDTVIFHDYILPNISEPIRFLRGRVKFEGINTKGELVKNKCGMSGSMIVIFDGR